MASIRALVEGANVPVAAALPAAEVAGPTAIEVSDAGFDYGTERLVRAAQAHTESVPRPR